MILVFAQIGEVEPEAAEQRPVIALQDSVKRRMHRPFQALAGCAQDFAPTADMGLQRFVGRRNLVQDAQDDLVRRQPVGERFVGQHEPMPQHVGREIGDVFRQRVVAAAQVRERRARLRSNGSSRADSRHTR